LNVQRSTFNVQRSTFKETHSPRLAAGVRVKAMVDDVAANLDLLARMWRGPGCEVALANDGAQGVETKFREVLVHGAADAG
jgi:hypothetical protein